MVDKTLELRIYELVSSYDGIYLFKKKNWYRQQIWIQI